MNGVEIGNVNQQTLPKPIEDFFKNKNVPPHELDRACKQACDILRQHKNPKEFKKMLWDRMTKFEMEKLIESRKIIGQDGKLRSIYCLTQHAVNDKNKKILKKLDEIYQCCVEKKAIQQLEKARRLAAIAILHFPYLDDSIQKKVLELTEFTWLDNSQKEIEYLQKIFIPFKLIIEDQDFDWESCYAKEAGKTVPSKKFIHDPLLDGWEKVEKKTEADELFDDFLDGFIKKDAVLAEKVEKESKSATLDENPIKKQQLEIIRTFLQAIVDTYLPICSKGITNILIKIFEDERKRHELKTLFHKAFEDSSKGEMYNKVILKLFPLIIDNHLAPALNLIKDVLHAMLTQDDFKDWLVNTLPQFFFQEPKIVSDYHKTIILGGLVGAEYFFHDIHSGMKSVTSVMRSINYSSLKSRSEETKKLVQYMNGALAKRKWTHFDVDDPKRALGYEFNEFLRFFCKNPVDEFICYFVATILAELTYVFAHKGAINVITAKIIKDGISFDVPKNNGVVKIPQEDKEFSEKLGDQFSKLTEKIINFSAPGKVRSFFLKKMAAGAFYLFKEKLGSITQGGLNSALMSECTIRPVVMLRQVLFKEEDQNIIPVMQDCLKKTKEEMQECKEIIKKAIDQDLLFELIKEFVKSDLLFQTLCKNLTNHLFILFQNEEIVMILVHYILQGVKSLKQR